MKKYEILQESDLDMFLHKIKSYYNEAKSRGVKFDKVNIIVKRWRKDRTPKQLRFYWVVISELTKAFREMGHELTRDEVHEFTKRSNGFTKSVMLENGVAVCMTKSIADSSDDINTKKMGELIDFAIRFAAINLNYAIQDPRYGS